MVMDIVLDLWHGLCQYVQCFGSQCESIVMQQGVCVLIFADNTWFVDLF